MHIFTTQTIHSNVCEHIYIHTHAYMLTCTHSYTHDCRHTYIGACVRVYALVPMHTNVCVDVCAIVYVLCLHDRVCK